VEAFVPKSGDYSWEITAYGEDGSAVCTTPGTTFSKPDSFPKPDKPQGDPGQPGEPPVMPTDPPMQAG